MITKGGVGSGIRGHRTIREMINGIPSIRRFKVLETLKQERARRDAEKNKPVEKPKADPKVELEKLKVERDKLQAELDKRNTVKPKVEEKPVEKPTEKPKTRGHLSDKERKRIISIGDYRAQIFMGISDAKRFAKVPKFLQEDLGITKEKAIVIFDALRAWDQRGTYQEIRQGKLPEKAAAIEELIDKSPKWDGSGALYRGLSIDSKSFKNLKPGDMFDPQGINSWSSDKTVSEEFAKGRFSSQTSLILELPKLDHGTSIMHLTGSPKQQEVLASSKTRLRITNIEMKKDYYHISVEEVS